ncbi:Sorting nexin mvp1 [Quaeritorhiza haematococci]|nr:Sorting nexin mvp1 [Quaeritorhiza haematococci]
MNAALTRDSLVVNPWDAPEPADLPTPPSNTSSSVIFETPKLTDYSTGISSASVEYDTSPSHHPPALSASNSSSSLSIDHVPPEDPWVGTTVPKLDDLNITGVKKNFNGRKLIEIPGIDPMAPRLNGMNGDVVSSGSARAPEDFQWFLDRERVKVQMAPEKGGVVFKHVNYILETQLPPKKVGPDEAFLERRRRGLSRFINFVVNHPILREDETVQAFLTVDTDIATYRRQVTIPTEEEFQIKDIRDKIQQVPEDIDERVEKLKANLEVLIEQYRNMSNIMEKIARRGDGIAVDFMRFSLILNKLTEIQDFVNVECVTSPLVNSSYNDIAGGLQRISRVVEEQSQAAFDGVVESLKTYRDLLIAIQELIQRRDRALGQMMIDALEKRKTSNQEKLQDAEAKNLPRKEIDRLVLLIEQDQKELDTQRRRKEFIRFCMWEELQYYHQHKAFVSLLYQNFVNEQMQFAKQHLEIWKQLSEVVFELPTSGFI